MNGLNIYISYTQVSEYCNELHNIANIMKDDLNTIKSTVERMESSDIWSGIASDKFIEDTKKIMNKFDESFTEIENSILYMANCSSGYQDVDKAIMSEICNNLGLQEPSLSTSKIFN